jgi:hypothetical protein
MTEAQVAFRAWCRAHEIPHEVAYHLDEALAALDGWGCLRIRIPPRGGAT